MRVITTERARADRHLVAHRELPRGRPDLPPRQSAAPRTAPRRAHQAAAARSLGHDAWAQPPLRAPQPRDPQRRPQRDLRVRTRPRRTGRGREHLPRGHVHRALPAHHARRGRPAQAVPTVLVSRRHPEPRGGDHSRFDQRRRRARATRSCTRTARSSTTPTSSPLCVIGDGEAETGALATSWHSNKFLNPAHDGAVLPILHLNGWKIANPTVLARIPEDDLRCAARGLRVRGARRRRRRARSRCINSSPRRSTRSIARIREIQADARAQRTVAGAAALADDRAAHAEGVDGTEGRRRRNRSKARGARTRCRSPGSPPTPSTSRSSRRG